MPVGGSRKSIDPRAGLRGGSKLCRIVVLAALVAALCGCGAGGSGRIHGASIALRARVAAAYGRLPLSFERNVGQSDARVRFMARSPQATVFFTPAEAVLALAGRPGSADRLLRLSFPGARDPVLRGVGRLPGTSNYFFGGDRKRWRAGVPTYGKVRYTNLWPGIDASFYGRGSRLEYDLELAAGANPARIALRFAGAHAERLGARGDLLLTLPGGIVVRGLAPVAYQRADGKRREVASRFVLAGGVARVVLGRYDHRLPLTVDPVLIYSTYLGGIGDDYGNGIGVDSAGNAYITGSTMSTNFPTRNALYPSCADSSGCSAGDAFVTKLNAAGNALVYSTYLGGPGVDSGNGIAVDSAGDAYITGSTSGGFPVTNGAGQGIFGGSTDAFVTKLDPAGALAYSTYLGGSGYDSGNGIALDSAGDAFVTGNTSGSFPTVKPAQTYGGSQDAFVTKLNAAGSTLLYSTYLGGPTIDEGNAIAVDSAGNAYVTGGTYGSFPVTTGAAQTTYGGGTYDAFVAKLNAPGNKFLYATYLGGSGIDRALGIAVDSAGQAHVTGYTYSTTSFPTHNAEQPASGGGASDAFVTELNATGTGLVYSTYLGGNNDEAGQAIALDGAGNTYVTGWTDSQNFPTLNPVAVTGGGIGAFVTEFNPAGSAFIYSTYLGSSGTSGYGIAVDSFGNAYVTGYAGSLPTQNPEQPTSGGGVDAFASKLTYDVTAPTSAASVPACHGPVTVTVTDEPGGSGPRAVHFRLDSGPEQVIATSGNPGTAAIAIPEGNHALEYWGEDVAGNLETLHHAASVQVDTTAPTVSITSDQRFLAYEVRDQASVTIAASDTTSGLAVDPTASHVAVSTAKPGRFTVASTPTDRCGNSATATFTYTVVPYPVFTVSVDVEPLSGTVLVSTKGSGFVTLTEARQLPVGSFLDARRGTVSVTTATAARGRYQTGAFADGLFSLHQRRSQRGTADLNLIDGKGRGLCVSAGKASAAKLSSSVLGLLHANAHGRFRTRGRYSAATVRGTEWTTEDRCDGTLTLVKRGTVVVTVFRTRKTINVTAGKSYLARAP
jgi:hypothetical protein